MRIDAQYSGYQHTNDNDAASVLAAARSTAAIPSQFAAPPHSLWEGEGSKAS